MRSPHTDRMKRIRSFSKLLDSSIPLPGGYRIGLDGIVGLIPGVGDIAGGAASTYIIIESARLGASTTTLLRMVFNVLLESLVGIIPFLGDLFDFVWKANEKNVALLERQLASQASAPRHSPEKRLKMTVFILLFLMLAGIAAMGYLGFKVLLFLLGSIHGAIAV